MARKQGKDGEGHANTRKPIPEKSGAEGDPGPDEERSDFIRMMIRKDLREGKYEGVVTRFPPEPNGYLHIGHAKSIVLNFGVAAEFDGRCHLRFDDTNPETEEEEYEKAIIRDIRWLEFDWGEHLYYASDYFERFYGYAVELVEKGLAYVDSQSEEEIRETRGTVTEAGRHSPYRERPVKENLELLERMRAGEFPNGAHVLRAKIDMASPNMKMRDPLLYRIRNVPHYRAGDAWHIYPMYDFAHCLEDAIERITHSLCTLEFENNRDIYDWVLENVSIPRPRPFQTEFARLSLTHTVMSKRKLLSLVKGGFVSGWDDPRMPTLAGMRRRGYTPAAIRKFCEDVGVAKANATVEIERLEHAVRDDLNTKAPRMMAVLRPLKLVIESWPVDEVEWLDASLWPRDVPKEGTRRVPFCKELYIERDDFMEEPARGFRRLYPGSRVRLRHSYIVECTGVEKDEDGNVVEVRVRHDADGSGKKPKGTIHWVSARHAVDVPVRLYGRLFSEPHPESHPDKPYEEFIDKCSLEELTAKGEPELANVESGSHVQLERQGYFFADPTLTEEGRPALNRTVPLRDTWAKVSARAGLEKAAVPDGGRKKAAAEPDEGRPVGEATASAEPASQGAAGRAPLDAEALGLRDAHGLSSEQARLLASRPDLRRFFEAALQVHDAPASVARWVVNEVAALTKHRELEELPITAGGLAELARLVDEGEVAAPAAKTVLDEMSRLGESPREIVERMGLAESVDSTLLEALVREVIAAHPAEADRCRQGKKGLIGFFMGKVMEATGGKASPSDARKLLERHLGG